MPNLQKLISKWFVDVSSDDQFPPQTRHPGTQLQPYTDGNLVEPVLDGCALMAEFWRRMEAMVAAPNPGQYQLWLAQWKLQPVKLLGETDPIAVDAETAILDAARAGVKVYFLGSGHAGQDRPTRAFAEKLIAAGGHAASDRRLPLFGSQHQKFYIFRGPGNDWLALLGSADLNYSRWDRPGHPAEEPGRSRMSDGPSHDVTVRVQGPAVHDIALTFAERWNDPSRRTQPRISQTISTAFSEEPIPPAGPHSVQVLRTYGIETKGGYSWARQGEFTIWAAYLNAIRQASRYIYIEDQYFYPFSEPSTFETAAGKCRKSDPVYQLGEAIKRGVNVILLAPSRKGSRNPTNVYQLHARRSAIDYLRRLSTAEPGAGRFVASYLAAGAVDPVIHAKVMIVDDEFALVGSANVCRRSMTCDSEIHVGVVDTQNQFARGLRQLLWQEHLDLDDPGSLVDPAAAVATFHEHAAAGRGRVRLFKAEMGSPPFLYNSVMNTVVDPYRGPAQNESAN